MNDEELEKLANEFLPTIADAAAEDRCRAFWILKAFGREVERKTRNAAGDIAQAAANVIRALNQPTESKE